MARRPTDPRQAAEALFRAKPAAAPPPPAEKKPAAVPGVRETVSLKLDQDVLHHFQADGPGWQERINAALRRASGLDG